MARLTQLATILAVASFGNVHATSFVERQVPANATGIKTIISPQGAQIRYKQPGKQGICETTEGVDDYAGYISLNEKTNMFFWFFEARENPEEKPLTLWLNGGPGSDSLIGLFQEHGPCNVTKDLKTQLNPYSWNEHSNMLYLSQPVGVGFSYETTEEVEYGRYSLVDPDKANTTEAAAVGAWHILQAFLELSPQLDADIKNLTFNLWTESYGGHYGPGFYNYFHQQNEAIRNGSAQGVQLHMDTLGIIGGVINQQSKFEKSRNCCSILINSSSSPILSRVCGQQYLRLHGRQRHSVVCEPQFLCTAIDVLTLQSAFAKQAFYFPGGCNDQLEYCKQADPSIICSTAVKLCQILVEAPYLYFGDRDFYYLRQPYCKYEDPARRKLS